MRLILINLSKKYRACFISIEIVFRNRCTLIFYVVSEIKREKIAFNSALKEIKFASSPIWISLSIANIVHRITKILQIDRVHEIRSRIPPHSRAHTHTRARE